MGQDLYWIYGFNIIVNSVLSFFTMIILIEPLMRLLRVKHPRAKGVCRLLPFCKICIDTCFYDFSNWALLQGINPILAEIGARTLSIMVNPFAGIQFSTQSGATFSLADVIALSMDIFLIKTIVTLAIVGSVVACTLHLIRILRAKRSVDRMVRNSTTIDLPNLSNDLAQWMKQKRVQCALTVAVSIPCIIQKTIFFPAGLLNDLSQEEVEAIVAHEMGHFQWQDGRLRLICSLIAALFWWIPTKWWQRCIEDMQEQSADAMIHQFDISRFALAEAVLKTARSARLPVESSCAFVERHLPIKNRIKMILQEPEQQTLAWKVIQYGFLGLGLLSILFGKLWVF